MFGNLSPATRSLLLLNVGVFIFQVVLPGALEPWFALWPLGTRFEPWQLLTYGFLHGGIGHIIFNMLGLITFGNELERVWGSRRFTVFFLASVVAAALTQLIVTRAMGENVPTVGASGGIYGLLLGFAILFPNRRIVPLIPPIPMPAWIYAVLFGALELYLGVTGTASGVAHFAHLGGMLGAVMVLASWRFGGRRDRP